MLDIKLIRENPDMVRKNLQRRHDDTKLNRLLADYFSKFDFGARSVTNGEDALLLGGLCLTVFLIGLGRRIGGWAGALFAVGGAACGISGALVGLYPMNFLGPHIAWAMRFFNLGLLMMAVFSILALAKIGGLSRWLAMPGGLSALAFAAFLYLPKMETGAGTSQDLNPLATLSALSQARPAVWTMAVLEWASVLSVLAWSLWVALAMLRERRKAVNTTD